ncbi:MAG: NAD(P)(+) transhydrogenase (Re/Si-specific) subunit alpha, partial [Rhodothermales bacterium]|nr:NAD(P)(+) transhydrogenase (Re/Si-specific) subunit alpha [Rhodothermales bacterium]
VTREMVESMRPGSVIVDLAAANGGNCTLTRPDEAVRHRGVQILGPTNLPGAMPLHASQMYARTVLALVTEFTADGAFRTDFEDEIFAGCCVTHDGEVVHDRVRSLLTSSA